MPDFRTGTASHGTRRMSQDNYKYNYSYDPDAMAAITAMLARIRAADYSQSLGDPASYGSLAPIADHLNAILERIRGRSQAVQREHERLEKALAMVTELAVLKFDQVLELNDDHSILDGLCGGLNMLAEELRDSVVSKAELKASEREFRTVFDQGSIGVAFISLDGKIFKSNARYAELCGRNMQDIIGRPVTDFWPLEEREHMPPNLLAFRNGQALNFVGERHIQHPDGTQLTCLVNASRILDDSGQHLYFVGLVQDITENKALQAALTGHSKLTALGEMAGGIAHEINNPLGIIQGKASQLHRLMATNKLTPETANKHIEVIVATAERIAKIIRGLRSFSRNADKDPMAEVPVKALVDNVLSLCSERFHAHGIDLRIGTFPEVDIECRGVQLEQVILNLLNNAFDAVGSLADKWIRIEAAVVGQDVHLAIVDGGPGIPPQVVQRLMQPFFTTKEIGKGTGLGLSIAKGIVEDHRGRLVYDAASAHTRFVMMLPIRQPTSAAKP